MSKLKKLDKPIIIRMTKEDRNLLKKAKSMVHYESMSEWARHVLLDKAREIVESAA